MNFPFQLAKRYLFAKKSHNAINIISYLSMGGIAVGTMALIVVLSVFNGFDGLIKSMFNSFSPDIVVQAKKGKSFLLDTIPSQEIKEITGIIAFSEVVEENSLLKHTDRYHIGRIKGVDSAYNYITGLDTMLVEGDFALEREPFPTAVIGRGVAYYLGVRLNLDRPVFMYMPRRTSGISYNPEQAFNKKYVFPSGVFQVEQEFDSKYIFIPISMARELMEFKPNEVTAIELKVHPQQPAKTVVKALENTLGPNFEIKDRYQQNEIFYKTMQSEKWMIVFILLFILLLASFNIIGSLTMLIIEKKKDIGTLRSMGANTGLIKKIFLTEGWLISAIGATIGLVLGIAISWLQQEYGLIQLGGSGTFIIDAYPVRLNAGDIAFGYMSVLLIGFVAAWVPIRYITGKYVLSDDI